MDRLQLQFQLSLIPVPLFRTMKILLICSLPFALAHGGMQTQIETSEKLPSLVAAVGRPLHFSGKLKSAALCREAATPVLQRS